MEGRSNTGKKSGKVSEILPMFVKWFMYILRVCVRVFILLEEYITNCSIEFVIRCHENLVVYFIVIFLSFENKQNRVAVFVRNI